jgi:hypothetical protein
MAPQAECRWERPCGSVPSRVATTASRLPANLRAHLVRYTLRGSCRARSPTPQAPRGNASGSPLETGLSRVATVASSRQHLMLVEGWAGVNQNGRPSVRAKSIKDPIDLYIRDLVLSRIRRLRFVVVTAFKLEFDLANPLPDRFDCAGGVNIKIPGN